MLLPIGRCPNHADDDEPLTSERACATSRPRLKHCNGSLRCFHGSFTTRSGLSSWRAECISAATFAFAFALGSFGSRFEWLFFCTLLLLLLLFECEQLWATAHMSSWLDLMSYYNDCDSCCQFDWLANVVIRCSGVSGTRTGVRRVQLTSKLGGSLELDFIHKYARRHLSRYI